MPDQRFFLRSYLIFITKYLFICEGEFNAKQLSGLFEPIDMLIKLNDIINIGTPENRNALILAVSVAP
jgi:hypothetical protein